MDVRALPDFGRPRGFSILAAVDLPKISGKTSRALRARPDVSFVHAGFSRSALSGLRLLFISSHLAQICFAKADDVRLAGARREHQHVQSTVNNAQRLKTPLAIFPSRILDDQRGVPFERRCALKGDAARCDIPLVLSGVEADCHELLYIRIYNNANATGGQNLDSRKLSVANVALGSKAVLGHPGDREGWTPSRRVPKGE